jgi:hypothetical protein
MIPIESHTPAPLRDGSDCLFQTVQLNQEIPDHIPDVLPVCGFPKPEEQRGSVIYECPTDSCSAAPTAGGHGHPWFLRLWDTTPPRDAICHDAIAEALRIVNPDDVLEATDELRPLLRGRYDGLYQDAPSITITKFPDPPSNGPAVHTCPECEARSTRLPVYVWPDSMEPADWWVAAVEAYDGPVWSPQGPTEANPVITDQFDAQESKRADQQADQIADITAF